VPTETTTDQGAGSVTLRPLTRDDIPAWAALLAAAEVEDRTGEHFNEADLAEEMDNPEITVGKDVIGAFDHDDLVGYCSVLPRGEGEGRYKVHVEGTVLPARRGQGIGGRLVDAMVRRAEEAYAERGSALPLKLMTTGKTDNTAQAELLERAGFTPERWNFVMRTRLDGDLPDAPPLAEGYELRRYDPSMADAMLAAHNAAFTGHHPNFTPWTESTWRQWVTESRNFRPELSWLVLTADGEVAGYLQTSEFDAYQEATGRREAYVAKLGVLAEHRGRGVGAALLGRAMGDYRDAGFDEASLDVDSENPTGALGVYERAGFEVESRWTNYQRVAVGAGE
jgi:mycothiol synthase